MAILSSKINPFILKCLFILAWQALNFPPFVQSFSTSACHDKSPAFCSLYPRSLSSSSSLISSSALSQSIRPNNSLATFSPQSRLNLSASATPIASPDETTSKSNTEPRSSSESNRETINEPNDDTSNEPPFSLLSSLAATTLLQSDRLGDAIGKESGAQASSATNWIDDAAAFRLRGALDKLTLWLPGDSNGSPSSTSDPSGRNGVNGPIGARERQDEAITWLRWMRSVPRPMLVDLSGEARLAANATVSDDFLRLLNAGGEQVQLDSDPSSNSTTASAKTAISPSASKMQQLRKDFLNRITCKLILLPSGQSLQGGLMEPTGAYIFGKLLYGGVTRYRLLPTSNSRSGSGLTSLPRRAGERTERKTSASQNIPSWVQYGGTERKYDAVDMGPAMVLEWGLLPKIQTGVSVAVNGNNGVSKNGIQQPTLGNRAIGMGDMMLNKLAWSPQHMFEFVRDEDEMQSSSSDKNQSMSLSSNTPMTLQGKERNDAFTSGFRSRVGGLGPQIDSIVRRVLDGRVIRPAEVDASGNLLSYTEAKEMISADGGVDGLDDEESLGFQLDDASKQLSLAALEAEELSLLGLTPVRGLLLYGPPGTGKTLLAREIARALRARSPKIVSAPELLDRWVGGSERLVRELFHDAEAELAACNGDPSRSALHVIVIDEIDAVFRKRSSAEDSGEATRSSTVNQILAKLDGVEAIPNVLLIGMTNRRELLDEALLRPGRLEVQIEIPLPDAEGRREILQIHFGALRNRGRLSLPLCCAIDGVASSFEQGKTSEQLSTSSENDDGHGATESKRGRKRRALKAATSNLIGYISSGRKSFFDLADDSVTGGFSGAELEGLVRCAGSIALSRARKDGGGVESLLITLDDVKQALAEVNV